MTKFAWSDPPNQTAFPIAKAGYPFIFLGAFATFVLALLGLTLPTLLVFLMTLAVCGFFRDPDRVIPTQAGAIVSPADGKVIAVEEVLESPFSKGAFRKISIFMTVFNVHVNRIPFEGEVVQTAYHPGTFFAANRDKASKDNEQNAVLLAADGHGQISVVQIAGLIARRIICHVQAGDRLARGQRFGMICFGSRLDVYFPTDVEVAVAVGRKVSAGTSILGYFQ